MHDSTASFRLKWYVMLCWGSATCMFTSLNNIFMLHGTSVELECCVRVSTCERLRIRRERKTGTCTVEHQDTNNWCWWRYFNAVRKMSIALMVYSYCNYLRWCYIFADNWRKERKKNFPTDSSFFLLPHLRHLLIHQKK